jgi:hypothetical protein
MASKTGTEKKSGKGKIALGVVAAVDVIGAVSAHAGGGTSGSSADSATASQKTQKTQGAKGSPKSGAKKGISFSGDGDYEVGKDVRPGTYKTSGNTEDDNCYWERAKDAKDSSDSTLANDNVEGTSYVTIKATDKIFKTQGCHDWVQVAAKAGGTPARSMKGHGGMYRVGVDIAPGTYKSTGNTADDNCYWERTKDATHSSESVKANDNVTGTGIVTISAQDAYFTTTGCHDWKKTG